LAKSMNGYSQGVIFTSGGTEANMLAIDSLLAAGKSRHVIASQVEHASIRNYLRKLETCGYRVTFLPVDLNGVVSVEALRASICQDTALVTIQLVNSEIGTIQPIKEISEILKPKNIPFHIDAVQAFGKMPIDLQRLGVDALSVSSHKLYGPKGVGICYLNPAIKRISPLEGTTHEMGFRPGTVNLPGIAAFAAAVEERLEVMEEELERVKKLRRRLLEKLEGLVWAEGSSNLALPHILGLTLPNMEGQLAMLKLSRQGIMVATGSACHVNLEEPSQTLTAIGKSAAEAKKFIRISFGKDTALEEVERVGDILRKLIIEK